MFRKRLSRLFKIQWSLGLGYVDSFDSCQGDNRCYVWCRTKSVDAQPRTTEEP